jgi:C-terminal processing protease CtpA/Prc
MKNKFFSYLLITSLASCASTEKYNQQITKLHSPKELRNDVDYAHRKLQKLHPDLYWYINKDALDKKFNKLKNNLDKPISSKDFYKQLAPVIASIKQGHTTIYPPYRKKTKEQKKEKNKIENPFKPLNIQNIGTKLFIKKIYGKDSTLIIGSEILSINNENTQDLIRSFKKLSTGDGYNETFTPKITGRYFGSYYLNTHKQNDSILITLKKNDSIYSRYLYAKHAKKNILKKSIKDTTEQKLLKAEKRLAKKRKKKNKAWKYTYGYNNYTKEKTRNFEFIKPDSTITISYMKIRGFKNGGYKKFYKESFLKIDSANSSHLIIDIRDNLGGRLGEIDELYSYLTDKEYIFIEDAKMTKRASFIYPKTHSKSWLKKSLTTLLYPVIIVYQSFKVKNKKGSPYFRFKQSKARMPKSNNYKGNIYVLINGTSFSASSVLSTHLKATKRVTFVGEETGGAYNGTVAGLFAPIELPNSKVKMKIGLMTIKTPHNISPDGYGIKPDVYILTTKLEKDEQLEWVINDIMNI